MRPATAGFAMNVKYMVLATSLAALALAACNKDNAMERPIPTTATPEPMFKRETATTIAPVPSAPSADSTDSTKTEPAKTVTAKEPRMIGTAELKGGDEASKTIGS